MADRMKPGDWRCSICGDLNFASRTACRSCFTAKGTTNSSTTSSTNLSTTPSFTNSSTTNFTMSSSTTNTNVPTQKPGDWHCNCGEMNFASRTACRKCGAAKGQPRSAPTPQKRPGDWDCPRCNELNFARNQSCRNCKTVPSLVQGRATTSGTTVPQKPGDWVCSCGELNFARNQSCRKCRSSKPMSSSSTANNSTTTTATTATSATASSTTATTDDESGNQCVVCMAAIADTAITVCGHLALCMPCAQAMHACPLCRVQYSPSNLLKIFMSGV